MSAQSFVADLYDGSTIPSTIRFRNIVQHGTGNLDQRHGILGVSSIYGRLTLPQAAEKHSSYYEAHRKAFLKGKNAASKVEILLSGNQPIAFQIQKHDRHLPFVYACDEALVSGSPCDGHAKDLEGITSFQKMEFHFRDPMHSRHCDFVSTQYLHFSSSSLKANESILSPDSTPNFDRVAILSGMCLLSDSIVRGSILKNGALDIESLYCAKPTLYEMEYIARASTAIADVAAIVISRANSTTAKEQHVGKISTSITLDVPSWHYYQAVHENLLQGLCTTNEALQWLEVIEVRSKQVTAVFENSVRHELHRRGTPIPDGHHFSFSSKTNLVGALIHQALQEGKAPSLSNILDLLSCDKDSTWREFYSLLPEKERPQNFKSLGYLFYIFQVVRQALDSQVVNLESISEGLNTPPCSNTGRDGSLKPRCLLISIDDSAERKIYSRTQKILKKIRQNPNGPTYPTLVEIYLSRRVYINSNRKGSNLYLSDPSPEVPILSVSDIEGEQPENSPSSVIKLEGVDIIRNLYGVDRSIKIQRWFKDVGLG